MAVDWSKFKRVDQPTTPAVDWSQFKRAAVDTNALIPHQTDTLSINGMNTADAAMVRDPFGSVLSPSAETLQATGVSAGHQFIGGLGDLGNTLSKVTSGVTSGASEQLFHALDPSAPSDSTLGYTIKQAADKFAGPLDTQHGILPEVAGSIAHGAPTLAASFAVPELRSEDALGWLVSKVPGLSKLAPEAQQSIVEGLSKTVNQTSRAQALTANTVVNDPNATPGKALKTAVMYEAMFGVPAIGRTAGARALTGAGISVPFTALGAGIDGGQASPADYISNAVLFGGGHLLAGHNQAEQMDPHLAAYNRSRNEAQGAPPDSPGAVQALPPGADFTARALPARPAPIDMGGAVRVGPSGGATTPAQRATALGDVVRANNSATPRLPPPVVKEDKAGTAVDSRAENQSFIDQAKQALTDSQTRSRLDELGLTPDIEKVIAKAQARNNQPETAIAPKASAIAPKPDASDVGKPAAPDVPRETSVATTDEAPAKRKYIPTGRNDSKGRPILQPSIDYSRDSLIHWLGANGGVDFAAMKREHGTDPAALKDPDVMRPFGRVGYSALRKTGGMTLDELSEKMQQDGWVPPDSPDAPPGDSRRQAEQMAADAINGHEVLHPYEGAEQRMMQDARDHDEEMAEQDAQFRRDQADMDAESHAEAMQSLRKLGGVPTEDTSDALTLDQWARRAHDVGIPEDMIVAGLDGDPDNHRQLAGLIHTMEANRAVDKGTTQVDRARIAEPGAKGAAPAGAEPKGQGESFTLANPEPKAEPAPRVDTQGGLFAPATTADHVRAASGASDAERNGQNGGHADTGDGGLFDGKRPEQVDLGNDADETTSYGDTNPNRSYSPDLPTQQKQSDDHSTSEPPAKTPQQSIDEGRSDAERLGLRAAVDKALGPVAKKVEFLNGYEGLPDKMRKSVESRNSLGRRGVTAALYDPVSKRVFVFTHVIKTPESAVWQAAHEIAGHFGLRTLLGDKLNPALNIARQNPTVKALADAIFAERKIAAQMRKSGKPESQGHLLATEEALSELEGAIATNNFDKIKDRYGVDVPPGIREGLKVAIANFLKRLKAMIDDLFGRHVFSDEDVRSLLDAAREAAERQHSKEATASVMMPDGSSHLESVSHDDYRGEHSAPGREGASLDDLTNGVYPDDIYSSNGARYYGDDGGNAMDRKSHSIILGLRDKPNAKVTIYRAVPHEQTRAERIAEIEHEKADIMRNGSSRYPPLHYDKISGELDRLESLAPEDAQAKETINPGDWVSINRDYAKEHGAGALNGKFKVVSKSVKASEVFVNGDSLHEQGYWPKGYEEDSGSDVHALSSKAEGMDSNNGNFDDSNPSILESVSDADFDETYGNAIPSRRPGEHQAEYARRIMRKNRDEIKAAVEMSKRVAKIGRQDIRAMNAHLARQDDIANAAFKHMAHSFDKSPDVLNFDAIDQFETGKRITDPDFRAFINLTRAGFDQRVEAIRSRVPEALQVLHAYYMPHLYEDSSKATKWYQSVLGKSPMEGDKSFLKHRTFPTLREAMATGLRPISKNPVDWVLAKYHQMDKFIGMLDLLDNLKNNNAIIKLEAGQPAPEGFGLVDDPAFKIAGGLQGRYAIPEMLANNLNNLLSPALERYGAWRTFRSIENAMVSANLGWSAYHMGLTSIDNTVTHASVGIQYLADGHIFKGLETLLKSVPTILISPYEGGKLNHQWAGQPHGPMRDWLYGHKGIDPNTAAILDALEQGGARMRMNAQNAEFNNALGKVRRSLRRMQAPGYAADRIGDAKDMVKYHGLAKAAGIGAWNGAKGVGNGLSAIGEVGSFLIHYVLVPNQKMAARVTMLKFELDRAAKIMQKKGYDVKPGEYAKVVNLMNPNVLKQLAGSVVDKVDFRLGQLTYDNFFIPKIFRQVAQGLLLSPGWQGGSIQTIVGGILDARRSINPEKLVGPLDKAGKITDAHRGRFTNNQANLLMLAILVGGMGGIAQYLMSGIKPDKPKDFVAPRTGRKNADGSDERIVPPTYLKDHYEFFTHPLVMASHKLNPLLGTIWDIFNNKDYFGSEIRDPNDPAWDQIKQSAEFIARQMLPYSYQNVRKGQESGASVASAVGNMAGFVHAPAIISRSPFQLYVSQGGAKGWGSYTRTPTEAAYHEKEYKAENALRVGEDPDWEGVLPRDQARIKHKVLTPKPELQFKTLPIRDKIAAYDLATLKERKEYHLRRILLGNDPNRLATFQRMTRDQRDKVMSDLKHISEHPDDE